jgi:hypothetical protein
LRKYITASTGTITVAGTTVAAQESAFTSGHRVVIGAIAIGVVIAISEQARLL